MTQALEGGTTCTQMKNSGERLIWGWRVRSISMVCWLETQVIPKMTSSRSQPWVCSEEVLVSGHCPAMQAGRLSPDKIREGALGPEAT